MPKSQGQSVCLILVAEITVAIIIILILGVAGSAYAQNRGSGGGRGGRQRDQQQAPAQPAPAGAPNPADAVAAPAPSSVQWPWLESGSVFCASRDDLYKYQTQTPSGVSGEQPPICRTLLKKTGIRIVDHDGPSRTQVLTTDESAETGWTNTYLPTNPPAH